MFNERGVAAQVILQAVLNSFATDFVARQKLGGSHLTYTVLTQVAVPPPEAIGEPMGWDRGRSFAVWLAERSASLSASSWPMARALGYDTTVPWNPQHRALWIAELDAAMFHLYGYQRDDVAYVLDTFPILARQDRRAEGLQDDDPNWRTKRLILAKFDELVDHARAGTNYVSPDPPPPLPDKLRLTNARRDA